MSYSWPGNKKRKMKMSYYCPDCDIYFEEDDPRLEERTHEGLFRCPECSRPLDFGDDDDLEEN